MFLKLVFFMSIWPFMKCKTVRGVFSSDQAKKFSGQYVTGFYFQGKSMIKHVVNVTTNGYPSLYLYTEEIWQIAKNQDCEEKLKKSEFHYDLNTTRGNVTFDLPDAHVWHVVYVDDFTCEDNRPLSPLEHSNYIQYELQLFNPDAFGEPANHFSKEEAGLQTFYQVVTLLYFIVACIYSPVLVKKLQEHGPLTAVIKLISMSMVIQSVCSMFMVLHYYKYSKDGIGSTWLELLAEFLDMMSQFMMLYTLLSLSLGWTLGGSYRPSQFDTLKKRPAVQIVTVLAVLQGILFLWEQLEEHSYKMYHAHRSLAGLVLVLLRITLALLFAWNLYDTVQGERSTMKRQFYYTFARSCMLWFLCYPVLVIISWLFIEYSRYKIITMGVSLCQSVAVVMLYRLILSRSLFWEVSALSSTLPLRMDKNFGKHKLYS